MEESNEDNEMDTEPLSSKTEKHKPLSGDELSTRDKSDVPKVYLVWRFHCTII